MPIEWYSKKQATVETATYGAEFVAARVAKEQISAARMDLRYLGVPVKGASRLFGDNESVVKSGSIPHSKLNKRHQALSYHAVREAIASKILSFAHIPGPINPADILSKHWGYQQVWPTLRPVMFWQGDTADLFDDEPPDKDSVTGNRKGSNTDSVFSSPNPSQPSNDLDESTAKSRTNEENQRVEDENPPRSSKSTGRIQGIVDDDGQTGKKPTEVTEESVGKVKSVGVENNNPVDETKDPNTG